MTAGNGADDGADVLNDVFKSGRESGGDSAPPEPKEEPVAEAKAEEPKAGEQQAESEAQPQGRDSKTGRFVPVSELVEERKKYRSQAEEEMRLRIQAEERAKFYESQFQQMQRQPQQPVQQQRQEREDVPDPILDPQGYADFRERKMQIMLINERVNMSEVMARQKHGDELVNQALDAAHRSGIAPQFQTERDPFGSLIQWFRRASVLQEVGEDPAAYRTKIENDVREKLLADLKAGKLTQNGSAQTPPTRMPGTLADATGMGSQGAMPVDPQKQLDDIFATGRRRRAG